MNHWRRMLVAVVGVAVLAGGGSVALAKGKAGASASGAAKSSSPRAAREHRCGPPFAQAAADYLGLTKEELGQKLRNGQSLAQVATSLGKSVEGLKQAILDDAKSHLDQAVADGNLTSAQRDEMLSRLREHLDDIVNRTGPPPMGGPGRGMHGPPPGGGGSQSFFSAPPSFPMAA